MSIDSTCSIERSKKFGVITIFPEMFPGPLGYSIIGRGLKEKLWDLEVIDLKKYKVKKNIDDTPFGGGPGMIIKPDVLGKCLDEYLNQYDTIIYPSPKGPPITQKEIEKLSKKQNILFVCGRYEGIDDRLVKFYRMQEFCVGEIILCGGELPSMMMMEAIIRLHSVGNIQSLSSESFSQDPNLVEYSQYTRPRLWKGIPVPWQLATGNHNLIDQWRIQSSKDNSSLRNQYKDD